MHTLIFYQFFCTKELEETKLFLHHRYDNYWSPVIYCCLLLSQRREYRKLFKEPRKENVSFQPRLGGLLMLLAG